MNDLISVIVPIYNSEKYLERCIQSILNQSYRNIELILVNDGSKDGSLDICKKYSKCDSRIKIINKENQGVAAARNSGIEISSGEYIAFVDSDDHINENLYQELMGRVGDGIDVIALSSYSINQSEKLFSSITEMNGENALRLLFKLQFPTSLWAYMYSRKIIDGIKLNNQVHFFEDFEFNYHVLKKVNKVAICNKKLYSYEINDTSINRQSINDKKMTCLDVYNNITNDYWLRNNNHFITISQYFRSHFLISMLITIADTIGVVNYKYIKRVKIEAKGMLKEAIFSSHVPIIYKTIIAITAINPKISIAILKIRRKLYDK